MPVAGIEPTTKVLETFALPTGSTGVATLPLLYESITAFRGTQIFGQTNSLNDSYNNIGNSLQLICTCFDNSQAEEGQGKESEGKRAIKELVFGNNERILCGSEQSTDDGVDGKNSENNRQPE